MKTRELNIIVAAALIVLGGCSATSIQPMGGTYEEPILSAADARSMISVEVRALEPAMIEDTILASAD